MTKQIQRVRQTTDTINETQSLSMVCNILRSSLSSICYLRYLFPEENFREAQIAGVKVKALVPEGNSEVATLVHWLDDGVVDALKKHYLRAMVFSIFSRYNDPESLLESYTFKFSYPSDDQISVALQTEGPKGKEMTKEQVQVAWCTMIRTLITVSHTLPPLPSERHLAIRLFYYDCTPPDYQPPGFVNADNTPGFVFEEENETVEIGGQVSTKHHTVSVRLDTAMPAIEEKKELMPESIALGIVHAYSSTKVTTKSLAAALCENFHSQRVKDVMAQLIQLGVLEKEGHLGKKVIKNEKTKELYEIATQRLETVHYD